MTNYKAKYKKYKKKYMDLKGGDSYNMNVQDPWFTFIKDGKKTVEGRLNKGKFAELKINDIVTWINGNRECKTKIRHINKYNSFKEMLEKEGLDKVLPSIESINDGVQVYRKFYTEEDEKTYGVLAIRLLLSDN